MKLLPEAAALLLAALVPAADARAEMVSYQFQGTAYPPQPLTPCLVGQPVVIYGATPMSGWLTYETNSTAVPNPGDPQISVFNTTASLTVLAGKQKYSTVPGALFEVGLQHDAISFVPTVPRGLKLILENFKTPLIGSASSLPEHLSLALPGTQGILYFPGEIPFQTGTITSLTEARAAPEPGSLLLCVWGLAGFALLRRRRGKKWRWSWWPGGSNTSGST